MSHRGIFIKTHLSLAHLSLAVFSIKPTFLSEVKALFGVKTNVSLSGHFVFTHPVCVASRYFHSCPLRSLWSPPLSPPSRFGSFILLSSSSGWPRSPSCFLLALPCVCWGGGVSCVPYRAQLGCLGGSRWGWVLQIKYRAIQTIVSLFSQYTNHRLPFSQYQRYITIIIPSSVSLCLFNTNRRLSCFGNRT